MGYKTPTGSGFYYTNDFATPVQISNITNAKEAVLTFTKKQPIAVGDIILLDTPNWEHCNNSLYRVRAVNNADVTIEGLDSSDTTKYTPNGARGSFVTKVTTWSTIIQVLSVSTSGGEAKTITVTPLSTGRDIILPNGFDPLMTEFNIGYDPAQPMFTKLHQLSINHQNVAIKLSYANKAVSYFYGLVSFRNFPNLNSGEVVSVPLKISAVGQYTTYAT